jgi:predicted metal-dependent enzyme (double-stranded beta helix superfamily)
MRPRDALVEDVVSKIHKLCEPGVTKPVLEQVSAELQRLAARPDLFPPTEFAPPEGASNNLYTLSCDPDGRYALYLSSANPGKETPPHNHATWVVVVAAEGEELNLLYERTDDGSVAGKASLRETGQHVVEPGKPITLLPEDIHSIHVRGDRPTLHFHMYGRQLGDLKERLQFNMKTGECKHFPANPNIK